jgi:hypothetical protein
MTVSVVIAVKWASGLIILETIYFRLSSEVSHLFWHTA